MKRLLSVACAGLILIGPAPLTAEEPITLSVRPLIAKANGTAQLKVQIERNRDNRQLTWEVEGPTYYRSSQIDLNGSASPRSYTFIVRSLSPGEFEVRASLRRADDSVATARESFVVIGRDQQ